METREILKTLKEERKKEIKEVNKDLKSSREDRAWTYLLNKFDILLETNEREAVKKLPRGRRYTSFQTRTEVKEGNRFSRFFVDENGNGIEIVYEYQYVKVDTTSDDWGEDYGTGLGIRKEFPSSRDYKYELRPEIVEIRKVSGIEIPYDAEFVFLPEFDMPSSSKRPKFERLKKIESLITALQKLPEDAELSYKIDVNYTDNQDYRMILNVDFNTEDFFYYKVDFPNPDDWEGADYFDIPEEIHNNTEIAEEIGQKIVESLENGIIPDIDNIVKQEIESFFFNKERERLIEKGQSLADKEVVEKIDREYREKIISLLIGQKVKEDVEYLNKKLKAGETITENTDMGILIPIFIFPHKYLSDKEVADEISNLWEERKNKLDDYYISLAISKKG